LLAPARAERGIAGRRPLPLAPPSALTPPVSVKPSVLKCSQGHARERLGRDVAEAHAVAKFAEHLAFLGVVSARSPARRSRET